MKTMKLIFRSKEFWDSPAVFRRSCKAYKHTLLLETPTKQAKWDQIISGRQDPKHSSLTVPDPCDDLFTSHTVILKTTNFKQRLSNVHLRFSFFIYVSFLSVKHRTAFQSDSWPLSNTDSNIQLTSLPPCLYTTVISSGLEARQRQTDSLQ